VKALGGRRIFSPWEQLIMRGWDSFWRAQESLQSRELVAEMVSRGLQRGAEHRPMSQISELRELFS